jgi:hypothetical protein
MKFNRILQFAVMVSMILMFASCEYDFIKPEPAPAPPDPTDTIYFANQVAPIWENNGCTNCHKPGGISQLDLTASNAYGSLTSMGMYSVASPESSKIYTFPYPETGDHSYKYSSVSEAQVILQWITQGANNN